MSWLTSTSGFATLIVLGMFSLSLLVAIVVNMVGRSIISSSKKCSHSPQ